MPSNDVIQRTEQLIKVLRDLASNSELTGVSLEKLESIVQQLGGLRTDSFQKISTLLVSFNKEIGLMGGDIAIVRQLASAFMELGRAVATSNAESTTKNVFLGKQGSATKKLNAAITSGDVYEQRKQEQLISTYKTVAANVGKDLMSTETLWKENLLKADQIALLQASVRQRLTPSNVPLLPAGNLLMKGGITTDYTKMKQTAETTAARMKRLTAGYQEEPPLPTYIPTVQQAVQPETTQPPLVPGKKYDMEDSLDTASAANKRINDLVEKSIPLNRKAFEAYGLSSQGAENLSQSLTKLGMTSGVITNASTEMSTGITTVGIQAKGAGEVIQNFTAHLDKNGNVLMDTQKRFRSFGSAIMRDVVEVLKWTIAISAIYGPIRKMGEMLEQAKKIQLDMVDVQIVLGNSTRDMNSVFEASAKIATETSSSIEGVIEGYSLAAAASASAGSEIDRMVTTEKLLKDSMVLSKIANIDQKQALDTLVGSLSQLGMGLTQGTQLLDSWVAVSKKANVSVRDMSTSFTIVGAAAEEAGLSYNELNALIGTLAQSTNLSADELGNSIRGIIAAMQTDKAQTEFARYGIATKTVSGDFRDLMDILKEMKIMSQTGILDEKAMGALTQAGGGGARRGAQLSALVKGLPTAIDLVTISENANGDAAQAMQLEMGTLDAATTRLNNAFSSLAVTLGGEGGVLGFLTFVTNAVTTLVKSIGSLVGVMKGAAPIMAAFMLAKGVMGTSVGVSIANKTIPANLAKMFTSPAFAGVTEGVGAGAGASLAGQAGANFLVRALQKTGLGSVITRPSVESPVGGVTPAVGKAANVGQFMGGLWSMLNRPFFGNMSIPRQPQTDVGMMLPAAGRPGLPGGIGNISLGTLLGPAAVIALSNIGKPLEEAAPRVGAGIAGAIPGILKGSSMWGMIGSVIAMGFYDKFLTYSGDLATDWAKAMASYRTEPPPEEETPEQTAQRLGEEAKAGLDTFTILQINVQKSLMDLWRLLPEKIGGGAGKGQPKEIGFSEALLGVALNAGKSFGGIQILDPEVAKKIVDAYNATIADQASKGLLTGDIPMTPVQTVQEAQVTAVAKYATEAAVDIMNKALEGIATNATGAMDSYVAAQGAGEELANKAAALITAQKGLAQPIEKTLGTVPYGFKEGFTPVPELKPMGAQEAVQFMAGLDITQTGEVISATTEVKDALDGIFNLNNLIAGQNGAVTDKQKKDMADYNTGLLAAAKRLQDIVKSTQQASIATSGTEKLKEVIALPEMTPEQLQKVTIAADKMWRDYMKASGLTDAEIAAQIALEKDKIIKMGESISNIKVKTPGSYFSDAAEQLNIGQNTNIQEISATSVQLQSMLAKYPAMLAAIQATVSKMSGGKQTYTEQAQDYLYITSDKHAQTAHVDATILNLLMRDLIDETKKQGLQGIYNLPEGATFMVPVTAYEMSKATTTEMAGGGGGMDFSDLLYWLEQIANNTADKATTTPQDLHRERVLERERTLTKEENIKPTAPFVTAPPIGPWTIPTPIKTSPPIGPWSQTQTQASPIENVIDGIFKFLKGLMELPNPLAGTEVPMPPTTEMPPWLKTLFGQQSLLTTPATPSTTQLQTDQRPITTALNLSVDSNIKLLVDGRTLATIIKPYLYEDLLRFGSSTTSSTGRNVIA